MKPKPNVPPVGAICTRQRRLDSLAVRAKQARKVLEVGTSNGYSTLWLADAVRDTGGSLRTLEIDKARKKAARQNLREPSSKILCAWKCAMPANFCALIRNITMWRFWMPTAVNTPPIGRICSASSTKPGSLLVVEQCVVACR